MGSLQPKPTVLAGQISAGQTAAGHISTVPLQWSAFPPGSPDCWRRLPRTTSRRGMMRSFASGCGRYRSRPFWPRSRVTLPVPLLRVTLPIALVRVPLPASLVRVPLRQHPRHADRAVPALDCGEPGRIGAAACGLVQSWRPVRQVGNRVNATAAYPNAWRCNRTWLPPRSSSGWCLKRRDSQIGACEWERALQPDHGTVALDSVRTAAGKARPFRRG